MHATINTLRDSSSHARIAGPLPLRLAGALRACGRYQYSGRSDRMTAPAAAMAPAVPAAPPPRHAAADATPPGAPSSGAPWLVTSEHLDPDLPQTKQLHLVVLNWHLPVLTARLWGQGAQRGHKPSASWREHLGRPLRHGSSMPPFKHASTGACGGSCRPCRGTGSPAPTALQTPPGRVPSSSYCPLEQPSGPVERPQPRPGCAPTAAPTACMTRSRSSPPPRASGTAAARRAPTAAAARAAAPAVAVAAPAPAPRTRALRSCQTSSRATWTQSGPTCAITTPAGACR
jgi:hypothetical protein